MTVIEFLRKFKSDYIVNCLIKSPGYFEMVDWNRTISDEKKKEIKEKAIISLIEEFDNIKNKEIQEVLQNDVLVVIERIYDDSGKYFDACLFEIDNFKIDEYDKGKNPLFGLCFSSREKILSLKLGKYCIEKYGEENVLQAIAKELTTFSIDENIREEIIDRNIKSLEKSINSMEKEEEVCLEDIDDVFDSIRKKYGFNKNKDVKEKIKKKELEQRTLLYLDELEDIILKTYKEYIK